MDINFYDICFNLGMELFDELEDGRIHIICDSCYKHRSNMTRITGVDPDSAIILIETCPICINNIRKYSAFYFDKNGVCISEKHIS